MTIPVVEITPNGFSIPTHQEVQEGVRKLLKDAFGDNLNDDPRTPQGQLITSLTVALMDRDAQLIEQANNFDPRYATGKYQEALGALYFLTRKSATHSTAYVEFMGLDGTTIPLGTKVQDDNNNVWETVEVGTIDASGIVTLKVQALEAGEIYATIGSINQMVDEIDDVDRVESITPAVAGLDQESRTDFEIRRAESVAANSQLTNGAVHGAVFELPDVIDVKVIDNPTDVTVNVGVTNYPMIRNSLLVSVVGGNDYDIAGAIMKKGGTGCSFAGNTTINWRDDENFPNDPYAPNYDVTFLRPTYIPLYFDIQVADYGALSVPQIDEIKECILHKLSSGEHRARIGMRLIPMDFSCELLAQKKVIRIRVSTDDATWEDVLYFGVDEFPASAANMITIRQFV